MRLSFSIQLVVFPLFTLVSTSPLRYRTPSVFDGFHEAPHTLSRASPANPELRRPQLSVIYKRDGLGDSPADAFAVVLGIIIGVSILVATIVCLRLQKTKDVIRNMSARMVRGLSNSHLDKSQSIESEHESNTEGQYPSVPLAPITTVSPHMDASRRPLPPGLGTIPDTKPLPPILPSPSSPVPPPSDALPRLSSTHSLQQSAQTEPSNPQNSPSEVAIDDSERYNPSRPISEITEGRRLDPIRTSLAPTTPRHSISDVVSMSDRSLSLADFPIPPPIPLMMPVLEQDRVPSSPSRDLTDTNSPPTPTTPTAVSRSPTPTPTATTPTTIIGEDLTERTLAPPDSPTSPRPPTYHGSWRGSPSQSSFVTLPSYPGGESDDERASQISRAPTYRSTRSTRSNSMMRGPRTPRTPRTNTRPPLPFPPPPSSFPLEKYP